MGNKDRRESFLEGIAPIEMLTEHKVIDIKELTLDARLQQRAGKDEDVIADYATKMVDRDRRGYIVDGDGQPWPEVLVMDDGNKLWVYDGHQRIEAAVLAGRKTFQATIKQGTFREAWVESLYVNIRHGKALSNPDKRKIVIAHLEDEEMGLWTDGRISSKTGISADMIGRTRAALIQEERIPYRPQLLSADDVWRPAGRRKVKPGTTQPIPSPTIRKKNKTDDIIGLPQNKPPIAKPITKDNQKDLDAKVTTPQDETELPYNPVEISPPKAEQPNEVTQDPVVYGNPGNWLMVDDMKKSDWTSLAGRLAKQKVQTFIAPAPHQSPHMSDPLQWVAKYTGALAGRVFKQVIIVGRKVYFVWSSNDLELPAVFESEEHLSEVLEAART